MLNHSVHSGQCARGSIAASDAQSLLSYAGPGDSCLRRVPIQSNVSGRFSESGWTDCVGVTPALGQATTPGREATCGPGPRRLLRAGAARPGLALSPPAPSIRARARDAGGATVG